MNVCDSSTIYQAIHLNQPQCLVGQCTSALAVYELGNVVWKNSLIGKKYSQEEAAGLLVGFEQILEEMRVVHFDLNDIYKMAAKFKISFYDAAYVALAVDMNIPLVTLDQKLAQKAAHSIKVLSFDQFIKS
jgi:predicted nucleic acid-binding protein